jgi:hypothetical protein
MGELCMDEAADLRLKAEACRRLAEIEVNNDEKMLWLERAAEWDKLAIRADKHARVTAARRRTSRQ